MMLQSNHSHEPPHKYDIKGAYSITAATLDNKHLFNTPEKLTLLQSIIFEQTQKYGWKLQAWAILINHYHLIISNIVNPENLPKLMKGIHGKSAVILNNIDQVNGRKVWRQYWDTSLTFTNSYYARIKYVINNPVKHKLVTDARDYLWCSATSFYENADKQFQNTVLSFNIDKVTIEDDFL